MSIETNLKKIVTIDSTAKINSRLHTVFKLDFINSKKYIKILELNKPFDNKLINTVIETGIECINTFTFSLCYIGFNEIIYYLKPISKDEENNGIEHEYNGRIQKMISILTSKLSATFYSKIIKYFQTENITNIIPYWECKIIQFNNFNEVIEYINERTVYTLKNSKTLFINHHLPDSQLSSKEAIKKIQSEKQINFNDDISDNIKVGCIITYILTEFDKDIEFDNEIKTIKFIRKTPICQNFNPLDIINIKFESLL